MTSAPRFRPARPEDQDKILALAEEAGLVAGAEVEQFDGMLRAYFDGTLDKGSHWVVDGEQNVQGAAYFAPEMLTDGTWNLYFIAVQPGLRGKGRGGALLRHVEQYLKDRGQRLLIVETSGVDSFEPTRAFYRKHGYDEEARIREFYAAGSDKVVFRKAL